MGDIITILEGNLPKDLIVKTSWIGGGGYADALWTNDLANGEDEDWAFPGEMLRVTVEDQGKQVASLVASYLDPQHGSHLAVFNIFVAPEFRRKGLARAMYDRVEEEFGDRVLPYPGNEGGAIQDFWRSRLRDDPSTLALFRDNIEGNSLSAPKPNST